jgi:hypothetical protein
MATVAVALKQMGPTIHYQIQEAGAVVAVLLKLTLQKALILLLQQT